MTSEAYLVINRRGIVRMTKRRVSVSNNEIVVKLRVRIDDAVFARAMPVAELQIGNLQQILPAQVEIPNYTQIADEYVQDVVQGNRTQGNRQNR